MSPASHLPACVILLLVVPPGVFAEDDRTAATPAEVQRWIEDLQSDSFNTREAATKQLMSAGAAAVEPLIQASIELSDAEVRSRTRRVISHLLASEDPKQQIAVEDALIRLSQSTNEAVAKRAESLLGSISINLEATLHELQQAGARIEILEDVQSNTIEATLDNEFKGGPAAWRQLSRVRQLQQLTLEGEKYGDADLAHVRMLRNLRHLSLQGTSVSNKGLAQIAELPRLETLDLTNTLIGDAGVPHLIKLKGLRSLNMADTLLTDRGAADLKSLQNLEVISLARTQLTAKGFAVLTELPNLKHIDVNTSRFSTKTLEDVAKMKKLQTINVTATWIGPSTVKVIKKKYPALEVTRHEVQR